jgi:DNA-binding CsgD family transcriptional regulator
MLRSGVQAKLLSLVYAAATDRSQWQKLCDELNTITTVPVMMFGHDINANESLGSMAAGIDPEMLERHNIYYGDINPWMQMNVAMPAGMVGLSDQAMLRSDLFKTEFYNDWLRPQNNIVAGAALNCYRSSDRFVLMAIPCPKRNIEDNLPRTQQLLEGLAPHIMRSVGISSILSSGGKASFEHLQASPHAIIIARRSGRIGYMNGAAERFTSSTQCIYANHAEKLTSGDERLHNYLVSATIAMQTSNFAALPEPISLKHHNFSSCIIHAHIFPSEIDHGFPCAAWSDPIAGAFVITGNFGIGRAGDYAQIARSLGATPAESRLAQGLLDGLSLYEYADLNGVSRHTVCNQMNALLHKLDVSSQTGLVRKLYQLSSPFGSPNQ